MTASPIVWQDSARARAFAHWLAAVAPQHGLQTDTVRLASADASFRRYFRIDATREAQSFIIMDLLVDWQRASQPGVLPPYDDALLSRELALFPEWYIKGYRGITLNAGQQATLDNAFAQIKASNLTALNGARVYVHRDFMPRNLMLDASGEMGVLDFQDAVYGPVSYDIASLMRDALVSWDEEFVLDITVRYWQKARKAGVPVGDDFGEFYRAVEWMGLQRHLKVLGIFARLSLRDGKPKYLADTPRFMKYARATCARYRQLGPLMVLLDEIEGVTTRVGYTF